MSRTLIRLLGLALFLGTVAAGYGYVYLPWAAAHAHAAGQLTLHAKLTVFAPGLALIGLYLLVFAPAYTDGSDHEDKTSRAVMAVLLLVGGVIGFALYTWLQEDLRSLGYMSAG